LFSGAERYVDKPKVTRHFGERRPGVAGRPVFKPLEDPFQERVVAVKQSSNTSKEGNHAVVLHTRLFEFILLFLKRLLNYHFSPVIDDDENEFKAHRKAVREHLNQMKEYYGAVSL